MQFGFVNFKERNDHEKVIEKRDKKLAELMDVKNLESYNVIELNSYSEIMVREHLSEGSASPLKFFSIEELKKEGIELFVTPSPILANYYIGTVDETRQLNRYLKHFYKIPPLKLDTYAEESVILNKMIENGKYANGPTEPILKEILAINQDNKLIKKEFEDLSYEKFMQIKKLLKSNGLLTYKDFKYK